MGDRDGDHLTGYTGNAASNSAAWRLLKANEKAQTDRAGLRPLKIVRE
jgi:hypothetical protein